MNRVGPWIALDCALLRNPKLETLSAKAVVLFVAALCHCGDELTDGVIRKGALPRLLGEASATRGHLRELVAVELLEPCDEGWRVPGYLDWNPPRSWWEAKRAKDVRRQREWRAQALGRGSNDA